MPWYKSGTVSVAQNSNAVTGTGTAFIANSRVGDAFRGPDGAWYEVINIASDTAMAIAPSYQGANNAAGAYALAPMQGYVKDSADALRGLVNTYGTKLAALGTTGNYDILPVLKGGTGRTALGTAIAADVMTSATDTTEGRLVRVGDFGLGNTGGPPPVADANLAVTTGFFLIAQPFTNAPTAAPHTLLVQRFNLEVTQLAFLEGSTATAAYIRKRTSASQTWGSWRPLALGGANADITSLSGLTTALSIAQGGTGNITGTAAKLSAAAMVGTVSQTGGVPTGALMEAGANANGTFEKYACGTLICRDVQIINGALGAGAYVSPALRLPITPVGDYFCATDVLFFTLFDGAGSSIYSSKQGYQRTGLFINTGLSSASYVPSFTTLGSTVANSYIYRSLVVGRWF
ncbi:pyocin knob domain-containing protein [Pseudomonas sp. GB2N2]